MTEIIEARRIDRRRILRALSGSLSTAAAGRFLLAPSSGLAAAAPAQAAVTAQETLITTGGGTPGDLEISTFENIFQLQAHVNCYPMLARWPMITKDGVVQADISTPTNEGKQPWLAESWSVSDDGLTWTIKLRQGVKSGFGNELTAEDVKFTFDRAWAQELAGKFHLGVARAESPDAWKVVDKYTFTFTTSVKHPFILSAFASLINAFGIVDSSEVQKHATSDDPWGRNWLRNNIAGFGPWMLESLDPGREAVFRAHDGYFEGPPKLKRIIMRAVPESSNRLAVLQAGSVDIAEYLTPREREQLKVDPNITVISMPSKEPTRLILNLKRPPFDNPSVRKALATAVNQDQIIQTVYFSDALPLRSAIAPTLANYTDEFFDFEYDLERAKALLAESGVGDFSFELAYDSSVPEHEQIAILLRDNFNQIGATTELRKASPAQIAELRNEKTFEATLVTGGPLIPDPFYDLWLWYFSESFINWAGYNNPEVDRLIQEGQVEADLERRQQMAVEAQQVIMQDMPLIPIAQPKHLYTHRANVEGFAWHTHDMYMWYDLSKRS